MLPYLCEVMFKTYLAISLFALFFMPDEKKDVCTAPVVKTEDRASVLYNDCHLNGILSFDAFQKSLVGYEKYKPAKPIIAICDFSKPSDQKRFVVIDLQKKKVLTNTLVAHGKNSGEVMATQFSNQPESHKSSLGFFMIGQIIQSPKHGISLILEGLEKGKNDQAKAREIIMHGASYVCEKFIEQYGRLGRSFGCPALPEDVMKKITPVLANGSLLFIYQAK